MREMTEKQFQSKLKQIEKKNSIKQKKYELKERKAKYSRLRRLSNKMKTSNKILIVAVIAIILFTVVSLYIQYNTSMEVSSTLTTLWFSFWTVEIVTLAGIKVSKVIKTPFSDSEETNEETEDNE